MKTCRWCIAPPNLNLSINVQWSTSKPGSFTPVKEPRYPFNGRHCLDEWPVSRPVLTQDTQTKKNWKPSSKPGVAQKLSISNVRAVNTRYETNSRLPDQFYFVNVATINLIPLVLYKGLKTKFHGDPLSICKSETYDLRSMSLFMYFMRNAGWNDCSSLLLLVIQFDVGLFFQIRDISFWSFGNSVRLKV